MKAVVIALALVLADCAGLGRGCPAGLISMTGAQLFFGDHIEGGAAITAAQWQNFVDAEVSPRFPDGFTVLPTAGQWRGADGLITRETGHEVVIVLTPADDAMQRLEAIRAAYKQQFQQESVLLIEGQVCAGF